MQRTEKLQNFARGLHPRPGRPIPPYAPVDAPVSRPRDNAPVDVPVSRAQPAPDARAVWSRACLASNMAI